MFTSYGFSGQGKAHPGILHNDTVRGFGSRGVVAKMAAHTAFSFQCAVQRSLGGGKIVRGFVPLAEMFGYSTDLRSKTQGRGNYSMFFEKYEPVPKNIQEKVLAGRGDK